MKQVKRVFTLVLALVLALVLVLAFIPGVSAAETEAQQAAEELNALGLFGGTGTDENGDPIFELDRAPNRYEAITMLVRLLGKEAEAKAGDWNTPFTDVVDWAKSYVGYAYAHGLTSGTSETTFSGSSPVSASQYLTFVLRALGYSSETDFRWDRAWELSDRLGFTDGRYNESSADFLRGDVAIISASALEAQPKGESVTLLDTLKAAGAVKVSEPEEEPGKADTGSGQEQGAQSIQPVGGWSVGEIRPVFYSTSNELPEEKTVTVSEYSVRRLENGLNQFTLRYTVSETMDIEVFSPPKGAVFNLSAVSVGPGMPGELVFDLTDADLEASGSVTVKFKTQIDKEEFFWVFLSMHLMLTDGRLTGQANTAAYTAHVYNELSSGAVELFGLAVHPMDNGYLRFAVDYRVPEEMEIRVDGRSIGFVYPQAEPRTLLFDLQKSYLEGRETSFLTFSTPGKGYMIYESDFLVQYYNLQFRDDLQNGGIVLTEGRAAGEAKSLEPNVWSGLRDGNALTVCGLTAQPLDNGYTRFTLDYTLPVSMVLWVRTPARAEDGESTCFYGVSVGDPGRQRLVFDLSDAVLAYSRHVSMDFNLGAENSVCGLDFPADRLG